MKILVVEDNPRLASRIKQQLRKWYLVDTVPSGDEGISQALSGEFDFIILDLGLPDIPGYEVCRQIRLVNNDIPILVVTGVDTVLSKVKLFDIGADDYLAKPFDVDEIHARINAISRRRARGESISEISIGDLTLNPASRIVVRAGVTIKLRRKEFDILEYLATNSGRVMSRQMIINHAWSSSSPSWIGSVDVHIKQLRDKVDKPFTYPLIKTSYGVGYTIANPNNVVSAT